LRTVALLWRLPLAAISMVFYKTSGTLFRAAMQRHNKKHPETVRQWRVLSGEMMKMPIALPAVMTTGPRWNTHAIVATAGPLAVTRSLAIDPSCALRSARSWSVVVCTFPGMKTVTHVGSASLEGNDESGRLPAIELGPGSYWLALRYYHWSGDPELPSVRVDGSDFVPSVHVSPAGNDFYKELPSRSGFVYLAMHYHMWVLLRYRELFPPAFVTRQYLPLGNPDTEFYFGCADSNESIHIDVQPAVYSTHNVFLTVYSRASFPVLSKQIIREHDDARPGIPCTWLIRVQRCLPGHMEFRREAVKVRNERD
jgi:hypothetical protein